MRNVTRAEELTHCLSTGGVALIPTDTVYGLACDARNADALKKLYELKGRPLQKPSALLFFSLSVAFAHLPQLTGRLRFACEALLPGPVTLIVPNSAGLFPLACPGGESSLGLRIPLVSEPLASLTTPMLQSSANLSGGKDPCSLAQVPASLRSQVDFELDGGTLPGVSSTVVDVREFTTRNTVHILRQGALTEDVICAKLGISGSSSSEK